jgi:hypothetical protein
MLAGALPASASGPAGVAYRTATSPSLSSDFGIFFSGTDTGSDCDDCTTTITFPFAVKFYGETYTSALAGANETPVHGEQHLICGPLPSECEPRGGDHALSQRPANERNG